MYNKMSYELKVEIINAVRKRNEMLAKWIDLCSKFSFLLVLIFALINATSLSTYLFGENKVLLDSVTVFTVILSICFDFVFRSEPYKANLAKTNSVLQKIDDENLFHQAFVECLPFIKEIDVARARFDFCTSLKSQNKLHTQSNEDKLQPVDILEMTRQRYIILVLLAEILLFITMLVFLRQMPLLMYVIPAIMIIVGIVFMIADVIEGKIAQRKVIKIYDG